MTTASVWPGQLGEPAAQGARGGVGIHGQEAGGVGVHVGLVDARIGADPAMVRLDDEHALGLADDAPRLAEYDLHQPGIAVDLDSEGGWRAGRGTDLVEPDEPPLRLGHDLLADHEEIAGGERRALARAPPRR